MTIKEYIEILKKQKATLEIMSIDYFERQEIRNGEFYNGRAVQIKYVIEQLENISANDTAHYCG